LPPGQRFHVGELDAPIAGHVDLADRAAVAGALVEGDEAVYHGLARCLLDLRIERGADRQTALVQLLLAVIIVQIAPHFLGEIFGGEDVSAGRPHRDVEWLLLGLFGDVGGDVAVLGHAVDDVIAPRDGFVALTERIVVVWPLRQGSEIGGFGDGQFVHRLVEIQQ